MNNILKKIINIGLHPSNIFFSLANKGLLNWMSDEKYLKIYYKLKTGKKLNLNNPRTFNEKIQWIKLNVRNNLYTEYVDKYKAKQIVSNIIGKEYIIPTLGVYNNFDEINFNKLPDQFVLKCTHDSGGLIICKDKSKFNKDNAKQLIKKCLKRNYYYYEREWPYKNVEKKIICEKYMNDANIHKIKNSNLNDGLIDYKFYCFNGEPKFLYVGCACIEHNEKHDKLSYYNLDWTKANFYRSDHEQLDADNIKPENLIDMIEISKKLSTNIPFVRVDLYNINNHIYFSEFTFSPGGGFGIFYPEKYELLFGDYIKINNDHMTNV